MNHRERRYVRNGFSCDEKLSLYDMLFSKNHLTQNIRKIKTVTIELLGGQARVLSIVYSLAQDDRWSKLSACYDKPSISGNLQRIYEYAYSAIKRSHKKRRIVDADSDNLIKGEIRMGYTQLDLLADVSKLLVENSSMPQNQKELAKFGIDCTTELIKRFHVPTQGSFSVMGLSLNQLYALKAAAKECKLTKAILFPCPVNGVLVPCLKIEGGDIPAFYNASRLTSLKNTNMRVNASESEQNELIRQYGVVVYSSEH